ncbi:MAG: aspartate--tRNA ligase [Methanomassiliicoccus sp.]|nr:aspartate--tRNA ligase [Methanomassiliicoccus sp.]
MMRTHTCGELRADHLGNDVQLAGWIRFSRDHGGVLFFDLADAYGTTQVVFDPEAMSKKDDRESLERMLKSFGRESVISVAGKVRNRVPGTEDARNPTGQLEVLIEEASLLNSSRPLPFEVADQKGSLLPSEDLRLRYRFLDLRRTQMANNLRFRHRLVAAARRALDAEDFVEVETPMLCRQTPEGARDFIVPSRIFPSTFYALPQSPQLYKQMLMVGGLDKYYQVARCFRDEDSRSDRQPEFTQLDVEMSFVEDHDVQALIEKVLANVWKSVYGKELVTPFPRITFYDAMHSYGTDAPDIRYGLKLQDVTDIVKAASYEIFQRILSKGGRVECMNVKAELMATTSNDETAVGRNEVDRLIEWAKAQGMGGLTWMRMTKDGLQSNIVKYFPKAVTEELETKMGAEEGDLLLFLAGSEIAALKAGGELRRKLAKDLHLLDGKDHQFVWLVGCPLFQKDSVSGQLEAFHHAFVKPVNGDIKDGEDVMCICGMSYDLVLDGSEIGSGSVRCHDPDVQRKVFKMLGMSDEKITTDFGFFLEALGYGAPPHGGIAIGIDRLTAILLGCETIREVIAFPKNKKFQCLMDGSPAKVEEAKLSELSLLCLAGDEDVEE